MAQQRTVDGDTAGTVVTRIEGAEWTYIHGRNSKVLCTVRCNRGYTLHMGETEGFTLMEDTARRYSQGKEASYPQWNVKKEKKIFLVYKEMQRRSGAKPCI
jgi:hypothetical protein